MDKKRILTEAEFVEALASKLEQMSLNESTQDDLSLDEMAKQVVESCLRKVELNSRLKSMGMNMVLDRIELLKRSGIYDKRIEEKQRLKQETEQLEKNLEILTTRIGRIDDRMNGDK